MWKVKQIFDGEYGCEEREPGEKEQYLVVLVNENGEEQSFSATEDWIGAMAKLSAHTLMRIIISKPIKKDCPYRKIVVEKKEELLDADIEALIQERQAARKERNFARADEIRDELLAKGIILEDTREGVKWKRA